MLEIKIIRQNLAQVKMATANRGEAIDWDRLMVLDERRKKDLLAIETLRHQRNVVSEEIAIMKKAGLPADKPVADMRAVADQIKTLDHRLGKNRSRRF